MASRNIASIYAGIVLPDPSSLKGTGEGGNDLGSSSSVNSGA